MTGPRMREWLVVVPKPSASVRPIELATAAVLTLLALVLRWAPSPSHARRIDGLQEAALASARWASNASRPTLRQMLGAAFTGCAV